jgi:hypothetical protein
VTAWKDVCSMPRTQLARASAAAFAADVGALGGAPTWGLDRLDAGGAAALTRRPLQADVVARFHAGKERRLSEDELRIPRQAQGRAGD